MTAGDWPRAKLVWKRRCAGDVTVTVVDKIQQYIQRLPPSYQGEVLDFVE